MTPRTTINNSMIIIMVILSVRKKLPFGILLVKSYILGGVGQHGLSYLIEEE